MCSLECFDNVDVGQCWVGDKTSIQPQKNLFHISPNVLFQNRWRKKTRIDAADLCSPGKWLLKWRWWLLMWVPSFGSATWRFILCSSVEVLTTQQHTVWKIPTYHSSYDTAVCSWQCTQQTVLCLHLLRKWPSAADHSTEMSCPDLKHSVLFKLFSIVCKLACKTGFKFW